MPRYNIAYGWTEKGKFYLSTSPKTVGAARNEYASSREALSDAQRRGMSVSWEDPAAIDGR